MGEQSDTAAADATETVEAILRACDAVGEVTARCLVAAGGNVTAPQFRCLTILRERGATNLVALADLLGVLPSSATRMAHRLEAKRLIRRRQGSDDRREVELFLTARGARLVEQTTRRRAEEIDRVLARLPASDRRTLVNTLRSLTAAMTALPS